MMEYLKRKLCKLKPSDFDEVRFPRYYEENGTLIKEFENGEVWEVALDKKHHEILLKRLK